MCNYYVQLLCVTAYHVFGFSKYSTFNTSLCKYSSICACSTTHCTYIDLRMQNAMCGNCTVTFMYYVCVIKILIGAQVPIVNYAAQNLVSVLPDNSIG